MQEHGLPTHQNMLTPKLNSFLRSSTHENHRNGKEKLGRGATETSCKAAIYQSLAKRRWADLDATHHRGRVTGLWHYPAQQTWLGFIARGQRTLISRFANGERFRFEAAFRSESGIELSAHSHDFASCR